MSAANTIPCDCFLCGESRGEVIHRGGDRYFRTTNETFTVIRCAGCGLARLNPRPADLAPYYPTGYWHEPGPLAERYRRFVVGDHVTFARQALPSSAHTRRVLDIGCGSALFLRELSRAVPDLEVMGLDSYPEAAEVARRVNGISVTTAELQNAPFPDASFDLVTMYHLLEHVTDPRVYILAARRLLAPSARLIVQTPNLDCWQYKLFGARWNGLDVPRHLHDFRLADLRRLFTECGLRVRRVKHFSLRDNPAGLATTLAPGLEPVSRGARKLPPRNLLFASLTLAALPFAAIEAMCGHGSSVMIECELV